MAEQGLWKPLLPMAGIYALSKVPFNLVLHSILSLSCCSASSLVHLDVIVAVTC